MKSRREVCIDDDLPARSAADLYEFKMGALTAAGRSGPTSAVSVQVLAPAAALTPYVRRLELVETSAPISRTLFPESGLILGVRYAGESTVNGSAAPLPSAVLTGLRLKARRMDTPPGGGVLVAKFTATGAAAFLDLPLHHLFDTIVPLEQLLPVREVEQLVDEVRRASDVRQRVATLERFLLRRLRPRLDPLVTEAVRLLRLSPGDARIGEVARRLGVSQEVLEKRFRQQVGGTPKLFASILRFRRAVAAHRPERDLGRLALEAGYYDQAHFNRQFRAITGSSPRALLASEEYC